MGGRVLVERGVSTGMAWGEVLRREARAQMEVDGRWKEIMRIWIGVISCEGTGWEDP